MKAGDKGDVPDAAARRGGMPIDLRRTIVFPNRMREHRRARGFPKLLRLSVTIPEIPYIRLSKIERGEVVPRADELRRVARALDLAPAELLIDVDAPEFSLAAWAQPFEDGSKTDEAEEHFAVYLGAAVRARRTGDPVLTIAAIGREFGIPPVNLSRIENALKTFDRWNAATRQALLRFFGVQGEPELRAIVEARRDAGALDAFVTAIADPAARRDRMRARIAQLAAELAEPDPDPLPRPALAIIPSTGVGGRLLPVLGTALADGLISGTPTDRTIEAPPAAGPRAFALKVCRATLGAGLPAQATVIVDPDQFPVPGGLAALHEGAGWRLLSVGSDRDGRMIGYSLNPELALTLDEFDPSRLARVIAAVYV
ncbi:helix-turn-helix domain-containing protein [Sphingomonas sp. DT-207]|uniref:helix-turn-helix domain-containing protein n=1 Tax=Sphingomonas sp. DT-207 TaxID=3396167 RepID=UPI003F19C884